MMDCGSPGQIEEIWVWRPGGPEGHAFITGFIRKGFIWEAWPDGGNLGLEAQEAQNGMF